MMKKLLFCLLTLVGTGMFYSCQQDDVVNEAVATKGATIRATLPGDVQSRLALGEAVNGNFPVYWEADDKITVEIGGETYTFSILEHDKNNATFYCEDAPANLPQTTVAYEFVYNSNASGTLDCLKMKASVDTANGAIAWKDVTLEFIATSAVIEVSLPAGVSATKVSLYNSTNGALIGAVTAPTDGSITDKAYMAVDATEIAGAIILAETSDKVYIAEVGQAELTAGKLYQITKEMAEATPVAGGETDEDNVKYAVVNGNAYIYGTGAMKTDLFYGNTNITRAVILEGVTDIAIWAFGCCSNLTNVTLPNTLVMINGCAFFECANINTIEIPSSVTFIGGSAFQKCSGLTNVVIPEGVTTLEGGVFNGCSNLVSVTIPSTLTSCGFYPFWNCTNLKTVNLKDGLKRIYERMFVEIPSLESITIPSSVISIDEYAFDGCTGLQNVIIKEETGKGLQNISEGAFYKTGLKTINLPSTLTTIGVDSFVLCNNLESITIPANVASIGKSAFHSCEKLLSVTCQATTPPTLGSSAFNYNADGRKIYVPSVSFADYKAAENWSTYADYIEAIP